MESNPIDVYVDSNEVSVHANSITVVVSPGYIGTLISDVANVGAGAELYKGINGTVLEFRTLVAGDDIDITQGTNEVTIAATPRPITRTVKTANHILELADAYTMVDMNVAGDNTVTIPPNSSVAFEIGTSILISQYGAGVTEILEGSGVTIRSESSYKKIYAQYCAAVLIKIGTNEWYLQGALKA